MSKNKQNKIGLSPQSGTQSAHFLRNAVQLHQSGDLKAAEIQYRQALQLNPASFEALHFFGILKAQMGESTAAIELFNQALNIDPRNEHVYLNRGLANQKAGKIQLALADFLKSAEIAPQYAEAFFNIGNAYQDLGDFSKAVIHYDKAISLNALYAEAFNNRGNALQELGQNKEALKSYQKALEVAPNYAEAYFNCGTLFQAIKDFQGAIKYFDKVIELEPQFIEAYVNNGDNFDELNNTSESLRYYNAALKIDPNSLEARYALVLSRIPKIFSTQEELAASRKIFGDMLIDLEKWVKESRIHEGYKVVGSHQPFFLAYQDINNRDLLSRYGSICSELMRDLQAKIPIPAKYIKQNKIRIGIVSAFIHRHSVWDAIIKGWVSHLDKNLFDIHIFHLGEKSDDETLLAKSSAASLSQGKHSLSEWVELIQSKGIDCLIYPEIGMDRLTCQLASLRIANVQATSWGHPETSGLPTLDYFLSAELFENTTSQDCYSERLVPLPNLGCCYVPYQIDPQAPNLASLGIDPQRPIALCPGSPYKYNPENDWVLLEIARCIPEAQLIFFEFPDMPTEALRSRLSKLFAQSNLNFKHQVIFIPLLPVSQFYGLMKAANVFLDTLGFSGFNTAIQAVECGLPIVTLKGQFMRGRLASGILEQMGLHSLVSRSHEDYVRQAVKIITDSDYRLDIATKFLSHRQNLYGDLKPIKALEDFLVQTCAPKV